MLTSLMVAGLAILPFLVVAGLLELAAWRERTRMAAIERQIALTDAIMGELGAVAAPVVRKPLLGPWRIEIAVPLARAATVATILAIAHRVLAFAHPVRGSYQIVLTPREEGSGMPVRSARASIPRAKAA